MLYLNSVIVKGQSNRYELYPPSVGQVLGELSGDLDGRQCDFHRAGPMGGLPPFREVGIDFTAVDLE